MSSPCGSSEQADGLKEGFEEESFFRSSWRNSLSLMEERGSLLGLRQIYTGFHANGTPGACAKGHRGQIRGDEGYRLGEHHGKSPNPAWSGQGG